jgi:hypothetical protein
MEKECSRSGNVQLRENVAGIRYAINTVCKTWGCGYCAALKIKEFKDRVEYGASIIGRCWFITLTLKTEDGVLRDAQYVQGIWAKFWYRWRKKNPGRQMPPWLKVVEATKKGQPHLHLIVGSLGTLNVKEIHQEWSELWKEATGDSYVVWVTPVVGVSGAGKYLAKYMAKDFASRKALEALGFARRWSASQNWPRGKVELVGTAEERWDEKSRQFFMGKLDPIWHGKVVRSELEPFGRLLGMVGDPGMVEIKERRKRGALKRLMEKTKREGGAHDAASVSQNIR